MIDHLSPSQINLYIQCSLKYKFQYIDNLPRPFKSSGLLFGGTMHSALDFFHKQKIKGNGVTLDKVLKIFETDWFSQKIENEIRYKNGESEPELLLQGKQFLTKHFHSYDGRPVSSETPFSLPLIHPVTGEVLGPTLNGIIDLIEVDDVIVEFKTTAKTMDEQSVEDSLQLTSYGYAYQMLFRKEPKALKILNFVKTKTPKIVPLPTREAPEIIRGSFTWQRRFCEESTQAFSSRNRTSCARIASMQIYAGDGAETVFRMAALFKKIKRK